MKIYVLGSSGSGKTTFTQKLSKELKIPYLEIDRVWISIGGHDAYIKKDYPRIDSRVWPEVRKRVLEFATRNPAWVIDGNYSIVRKDLYEQADQIVLLYHPHLKRLGRVAVRSLKGRESDLGLKRRYALTHFSRVVRKGTQLDKKILNEIDAYKGKTNVLRSFEEMNEFIEKLKSDHQKLHGKRS